MDTTLAAALAEVVAGLEKSESFVRLVLSGRRRNMQTPAERIDVKPVLIKGEIKYQVSQSDGRAMTAKNYSPAEFIELNFFIFSSCADLGGDATFGGTTGNVVIGSDCAATTGIALPNPLS